MNEKIKLGIIAIVALILLVALIGFVSPSISGAFTLSGQKETTIVRMGSLPVIHGLPVYYAIEKGYFKEAGIDLQLIKMEAPNQIVDGIMQGNLDFTSTSGPAGISAVADFKNPGKMKIYSLSGGDKNSPGESILVPKDSNIKKISELSGKKLGIIGGSLQWKMLAVHILAQNNLVADKDVTLVEIPIGSHVTAIASGQVDALLTIEPSVTIITSKNAGKILQSGPLEETLSDPFYPGAGIVSTKFAKENPITTQKVIEIIKRANSEINSNPFEARKYLKGYTALGDDLIQKVPLALIKTCGEITAKDIEGLQKFHDIFTDYNAIDGRINTNSIMYCAQ
jgi:NitT/TauT family transport system substrate-binding protein